MTAYFTPKRPQGTVPDVQSLIAIGNGGITARLARAGRSSSTSLKATPTVFAIVGEELG